jgi:hypothetical protein
MCIIRCGTPEPIVCILRLNPFSNFIYKTFMLSLIVIQWILFKLIPSKYALTSLWLQINFKASVPHILPTIFINFFESQFLRGKEIITIHIPHLFLCLPKFLRLICDFRLQVLNLLHSLNFRLLSHQLFLEVPIPGLLVFSCYFSHRVRILKSI